MAIRNSESDSVFFFPRQGIQRKAIDAGRWNSQILESHSKMNVKRPVFNVKVEKWRMIAIVFRRTTLFVEVQTASRPWREPELQCRLQLHTYILILTPLNSFFFFFKHALSTW